METKGLRARTSEEAGKRTEAEKDDRSWEHEGETGRKGQVVSTSRSFPIFLPGPKERFLFVEIARSAMQRCDAARWWDLLCIARGIVTRENLETTLRTGVRLRRGISRDSSQMDKIKE